MSQPAADTDAPVPEVPESGTTARVTLSPAAADLLVRLTEIHGPLMFHQSGGCCDGSSPMCFPDGDFKLGGSDVHLGDLVVEGLHRSGSTCRSRSSSTGNTPTSPSTW
jgi:uncharacterized protein